MAEPHLPDVERRVQPRAEAVVRVEALDGGPYLIAHDIGVGGMLVTTRVPRWPGQLLRVRFRLPGDERAICATCRVVDLAEVPRGAGLALQFLGLAVEARRMIGELVRGRAAYSLKPAPTTGPM